MPDASKKPEPKILRAGFLNLGYESTFKVECPLTWKLVLKDYIRNQIGGDEFDSLNGLCLHGDKAAIDFFLSTIIEPEYLDHVKAIPLMNDTRAKDVKKFLTDCGLTEVSGDKMECGQDSFRGLS